MAIRAVFFDFGGVILRTEYQSPRQRLAERFNMDYDEIDQLVFGGESARRASLGEITEEMHWAEVLKRLKCPASEAREFSDEFFGGDILDRKIVDFLRSLRGKTHTGLISNAWSGLRDYLAKENIIDAFDALIISAEVGAVKPGAKIFAVALEQAKVRAEDALFVDDVVENIEACEKVGMRGVLFKNAEDALGKINLLLN